MKRNNPSVPTGYRNWEKNREELRILEGEAVQLRNKVYRQKRIRYLNEQSCNSNKDKTDRFEMLLSEMKTDLNILKKRLNDELLELGKFRICYWVWYNISFVTFLVVKVLFWYLSFIV